MNFKELMKAVEDFYTNTGDTVSAFSDLDNAEELEKLTGPVKDVAKHGGEGQGDEYWNVLHFGDHDLFVRINGSYTSDDGVDYYDGWESCKEVKPQEKTITVYE